MLKVTYVCTYIRMYTTTCRAVAAFAAAKNSSLYIIDAENFALTLV